MDEAGRQLLKEITGYVRNSVRIINPMHTDLSLYFLVDVEIRRVFCDDRLESCAICLEEYLGDCDEVVAMPCCHVFHESSITKWLQINHCCPHLPLSDSNSLDHVYILLINFQLFFVLLSTFCVQKFIYFII